MPEGIALERRELVVENEALLVKQAADQRRFSVIDRAAGEQPERRERGRRESRLRVGLRGIKHQK